MQHAITTPSNLLDEKGELIQKGYATSPVLQYRRKDAAKKFRLNEWDYYLIHNESRGIALTVTRNISLALVSVTLFDYLAKTQTTKSVIAFVPFNKLKMPESSAVGDIVFHNNQVDLSFSHEGKSRKLHIKLKEFQGSSDLSADLLLSDEPRDSMVIATPFSENRKQFYYNQKIIGMRAAGSARIGNQTFEFLSADSFGLLDWGRGLWPHKVTWYWSAAQGMINGDTFGFNLGYGFGDTFAATENMLFYNGIAQKLDNVTFKIPKDNLNRYDYMKPWAVTSSDHRLELSFIPMLDRSSFLSAVVVTSDQHQVFGRFSGRTVLDDGRELKIQDFLGFAEVVKNRW
jgi:hypothetical protein